MRVPNLLSPTPISEADLLVRFR